MFTLYTVPKPFKCSYANHKLVYEITESELRFAQKTGDVPKIGQHFRMLDCE
jgi:hypothetical protein